MSDRPIARQEHTFDVGPFAVRAGVWRGGHEHRLLLLHGLGGNSITWDRAAAILAARCSSHVVAIDWPGFGPTHPRGQRLSIARLLEVTRAIMAQVDHTRPWTILGNSLGGFCALQLARTMGPRVDAVVLASCALPLAWGRSRNEMMKLARYLPILVPHVGRRLFARYNRNTGLPGVVDGPIRMLFHDPSTIDDAIRERLLAVSADRLTWVDEAARAYEQVTRDLGRHLLSGRSFRDISCPVLAIHGQSDPLFPVAGLANLRRRYPHWRYLPMPRVGHAPQMEAPARFCALVTDFLLPLWQPSQLAVHRQASDSDSPL